WLVDCEGWHIYIYATKSSDIAKMNLLNPFHEHYVKVTGTLRYAPAPQVPQGPLAVAVAPEHFFFDVAEAKVVSAQKGPFIRESMRKPLVVSAAPEECLEIFRQFFRYVQRSEPSIVKDGKAQRTWL